MNKDRMKNYLAKIDTTIVEAMQKIDKNAHGLIFIVDENNKLLGCVTDGDIRRWLIKTGDLSATVDQFMMKNPKYVYSSEKKKVKDDIMEKYKIHILPILDKNFVISDIIIDNYTPEIKSDVLADVPLVIMAGGKGTRLYPYTQILPKPLIPIGDKTITELIIDRFQKYGCRTIDMIVNYKKHFIESYFQDSEIPYDIGFVEEEEFCGTGGGLKLLEGRYDSTFILSNCDILIDDDYAEIVKHHKENDNIVTMVCAVKKVQIPYGTIEMDSEGKPIALTEKPEVSFMTNTGLYVLEPEFLDRIPKDTFIHITDVIQKCMDDGENVGVYPISEDSWMDMGQLEEMERMKRKLSVD